MPGRTKWGFPENLLRRLRFCPPTTMSTGCIEFVGARNVNGYGRIRSDGRLAVAHRAVWEWLIGPVPDGLELDHLCRNRACVNVAHLEAVSHRENTLRGNTLPANNAAKTECVSGHPFDTENTYVGPSGRRDCRRCRSARRLRYVERKATR